MRLSARIDDRIGRLAVPLGQDEMNVPAIIEHLHQIGYMGWVSMESSADPSADKFASLAAARQYLTALM